MHFNSPICIDLVFFLLLLFLLISYSFSLVRSTIYISRLFSVSVVTTYSMIMPVVEWMWMWICVHFPFGCIKYVWTVSFVSVYFSRRRRRRCRCFLCGCCLYRSVFHRNLINFPCDFYLWLFNEHVATPSICFNKLRLPAKLLISC